METKWKDFSQFPIQRLWDGSCKRVNEIPAIPDSWHVILSLKTIHRLSTHYVKRTGLPKVSTWQKWPWWLMKSHCQHASRLWNNKTLFILLLFFLRFLWMWTIFFLSLFWICYNIPSVLCFGFLASRHLSFLTRDPTCTSCIGGQSPT